MDANSNSLSADSKLHFLDYWRIIRIRKTVIIAVMLLVVITTTVVTYFLPEYYMSTVRLTVDRDASDVSGVGGQQNYFGYDPYFILTEFEKIQSKNVLYEVIERLKLNERWAKDYGGGEKLKTTETFTILRSLMDVRQSRNTSLIEIRLFSRDPKEAAEIANAVADVYREVRLRQRTEISAKGIRVLTDRFKEQDDKVKQAQDLVGNLREKLNISEVGSVGSLSAGGVSQVLEPETLRRVEALRVEARNFYVEASTIYDELSKKSKTDLRKAMSTAYPDAQLASLLEQMDQAEQKLASMLKDLGENHPEVQRIAALASKIKEQVDNRLDGIMMGLATKVATAKARLDALTQQVEAANKANIETASRNRLYIEALHDLEKQQQVRDTLNLKVMQETIDSSLGRSSVAVITDPAEPGLSPVRPNKTLNITLGIVVGIILGIGLAFFIEYLDTSVKTLDDVERALQAPVLGVIPQNVGSLLDEGQESPHAESYRVLRSNLLFSKKDGKFNTMCVISAGAGEGKSTTIFNLACTFAQNGQRVVIVDSDLRRPSIHKFLRVSNAIGLTNYLQRQNTLEEVIQTTSLPTLDFLPSGKLPSSSMGILNSVQMKALIHELKRRYDFVFFDSPPILGVSDASIMASEVDMTLLVVQYRKYPQAMTLRAKQMIDKVGGNLIGVVLNNINMAHDSYYYYYSGFYSNYYAPHEEQKPKEIEGQLGASESENGKDTGGDAGDEPAKLEQKY